MKYLKQFGIILILSFAGELLNLLIPLPIPASIWGFALMFVCLQTGFLKLDYVKDTAIFLIEIMPLMFIPAGVGLLSSWDVIRPHVLAYLVIAAVTTFAVMFVSGHVTQFLLRRGGKEK